MSNNMPFIIYAESTPNPDVMKFVSNKILAEETKECLNKKDSEGWPLLHDIFQFPFVKEIFISNNYISIKKNSSVDWLDITNQIRIFIQEKLNAGVKICVSNTIKKDLKKSPVIKSEFTLEVEEVIQARIRPNIQMDGGDIEVVSCKDGVVQVFLKGACSGCPSSQMTLKNGIELLLKEVFPNKIKEVIAINK